MFHAEKHGASSMGSQDTVKAVVAYEWARAGPIHSEVHLAEKKVAEVDVEAAADANETKERSVNNRKFDRLINSIESVI